MAFYAKIVQLYFYNYAIMSANVDFDDVVLHDCPELAKFLFATGSLTSLLEKQAGRRLVVQVLSEGFVSLTYHQKIALNLPINKAQLAWQRSVLLYGCDKEAWVCASSIFPLNVLKGKLKRLKHLGKTPIGRVLFAKRQPMIEHRTFYHHKNPARDTCYQTEAGRLLISEQFLPAFINHLKHTAQ